MLFGYTFYIFGLSCCTFAVTNYRQIKQYSHLGMKGLTESSVDGWFKQTVELLRPLYDALEAEVMKTGYAQADETTTPVIDRDSHKAAKEYVWMIRAVVERLVLFHYDNGSFIEGPISSRLLAIPR